MILQEPGEQAEILIVDDTPDNLKLLSRILKEHKYTVRTAINGKLALHSVQAAPPALILLDVMMPEMDGYEVCRRLKADERLQKIPVIFLSGLDTLPHKMHAFEVGGLDYITKPFDAAEVIAKIRNYIAIQMTQRQLEKRNAQLQEKLSERRALEVIISQAKKEWEYTFDAVPDLIFILDRDFRILRINKAAAHHLQLESKDCIGQTCYSLFHETVHAPAICPHARMLSEHQECTQEMCDDFKGGPFLITVSPVLDDEKNLIGSVHIARDISKLKKAEELLLHSQETAELSNRAKNHFFANMGRELRDPLNAVIGFSQLLANHPKLNAREREHVKIILQNSERLLNVINRAVAQ